MGTEVSSSIFPSKVQLHMYPPSETALSVTASRGGWGLPWHGRGATGERRQAKQEVPLFAMVETAIGNTTGFEMRDALCDKITR